MASINNAYPETYKIELVKRYLNGEMQKKIVKEHNIAKSTFYSWVCKYSSLIGSPIFYGVFTGFCISSHFFIAKLTP